MSDPSSPKRSAGRLAKGAKLAPGATTDVSKRAQSAKEPAQGRSDVQTGRGPMTRIVAEANRRQAASSRDQASSKPKAKTRVNKKGLVLYVEPEVTVALRRLALDTGSSVQELGMDALNLLFDKYGIETFETGRETSS